MEFDHYHPAPSHVQEQVISEATKAKEQEA
jgi:hypothetical protein